MLAFLLWLTLADPVSMTVRPRVCSSPCDVTVELSVEPSRENDSVILELVGEEYSRKTNMNYAPYCYADEHGREKCRYPPKTAQITYPGVPGGNYVVKATLVKHDGKTWIAGEASQTVLVNGFMKGRD